VRAFKELAEILKVSRALGLGELGEYGLSKAQNDNYDGVCNKKSD
jgi:hypothetical protein